MKRSPQSRERTTTPARRSARGVTLMELLCVLAILAVIASLYLPAIARAYSKVKHMFGSE
ncbi:MAG: prepilin-type N-terminal cleavage/methylation domain-containing protein [Verrucomicrobiales bacterium]|nr:prepilin-type N-terminal cleavage/methylation domain-containing protein [Verrucomicrobiales bacterium]